MNKVIIIYDSKGLYCTEVKTIEAAAQWIDCSTMALYKNMQLSGVMSCKGFTVELEDDQSIEAAL